MRADRPIFCVVLNNYPEHRHNIAPEMVFERWEDLAAAGKVADAVLIATQVSVRHVLIHTLLPTLAYDSLCC